MAEETKPAKWWQQMLTTPALLLALGGGVGTAVPALWNEWKAYKLGVQGDRVQIAIAQQKLWEANLDCVRLKPVYTIALGEGVEVGVTLCHSGAALLRYQRSPETVQYTWIPFPQHRPVPEAQHSRPGDVLMPHTQVVVGVTRCILLQQRLVLWVRITEEPLARCQMEYITTVRGVLLKQADVACSTCDL